MATRTEILTEIKALAAHFPRRQMASADMLRWFDDYAADLDGGGFDAVDIRIACANWRTSEAKHMASPGELLAYCRKVFRPERVVLPPPRRSTEIDPAERRRVGEMMRNLASDMRGVGRMDFNRLARKPGETQAEQAERLWPNHRADRMVSRRAEEAGRG